MGGICAPHWQGGRPWGCSLSFHPHSRFKFIAQFPFEWTPFLLSPYHLFISFTRKALLGLRPQKVSHLPFFPDPRSEDYNLFRSSPSTPPLYVDIDCNPWIYPLHQKMINLLPFAAPCSIISSSTTSLFYFLKKSKVFSNTNTR